VLNTDLDGSGPLVAAELLAEAAAAVGQIEPKAVLGQQATPQDIYQLAIATFHEALGLSDAQGSAGT
jgi:hypothetical protein